MKIYISNRVNSSKDKNIRSLNVEEQAVAKERFGNIECSIMKDENGYFAMTHRARSKSYPTLEKLPKSKVDFISSTS